MLDVVVEVVSDDRTQRLVGLREYKVNEDEDGRIRAFFVDGLRDDAAAARAEVDRLNAYMKQKDQEAKGWKPYFSLREPENGGLGVFAHEYQHLLQSYADSAEVNFVNEGLSDFAISLTGYANTTAAPGGTWACRCVATADARASSSA